MKEKNGFRKGGEQMKRLHYEIRGMTCAACVSHVERAIRSVLGENETFTVSLLTNSVSLLLSDDRADAEETVARLKTAVANAGYTLLTEPEAEPDAKKRADARWNFIRLWISVGFTLLLLYLSMGGMIGLPIPSLFTGTEHAMQLALAEFALTLPVLVLNFRFFKNGFRALFHRSPNMDSLIAVGSGAAVIYGIVACFAIGFASSDAEIHRWVHDLYFESAAMILTLVSVGKTLEARAKEKASDAVRSLASLVPATVAVRRDGVETAVPVGEVIPGDLLLIRAGEMIPVDGIVTDGNGSTDESALTGESMPVEKCAGDGVRAASVLTSGFLTVRAEAVGEETSLSRIIRLLEDAAASKAPIARVADRVSAIFVPIVMAVSAVALIVWLAVTGDAGQALRAAISVLVISCPCALGLATPTAITVSVGRGAGNGILFRNAEALEKFCGVKTVVFDKTGTVTEGKPSLTDVFAYGISAPQLLSACAAVERRSAHPLALAVCRYAESANLPVPDASEFELRTGIGVSAKVSGALYEIGKPTDAWLAALSGDPVSNDLPAGNSVSGDLPANDPSFVSSDGLRTVERPDADSIRADFAALERAGKTAVLVTRDGEPCGILGIADRIRSDSPAAIAAFRSAGVRCLLLTGDNERTAASVAAELGMDGYYARLLPEDKERMVRELSAASPCAMIGDGINDAPALARADVGIAIGAGTDVAIESAGVVLSGSSLSSAVEAYFLSRATIRVIRENLFWALFYNAICIPVAAGVFFPLFGWQLSPMLASAAMSLSSLCVVTNALRLRRIRLLPPAPEPHDGSSKSTTKTISKKGDSKMLFGKNKNAKKAAPAVDSVAVPAANDAPVVQNPASGGELVYKIAVDGMMCQHCVMHVKNALAAVSGVLDVSVDLDAKCATVRASATFDPAALSDALSSAVTAAGYTPGAVVRE